MSAVDVVVVGGGYAGFCAAHAAAERGRRVLLLAKAPRAEAGGNSYYTAGATRMVHDGLSDLLGIVEPDERHGRAGIDLAALLERADAGALAAEPAALAGRDAGLQHDGLGGRLTPDRDLERQALGRRVGRDWPIGERAPSLVDNRRAPDIDWVARLGAAAIETGAPPKPLYLRAPDAQPQKAAQLARQ